MAADAGVPGGSSQVAATPPPIADKEGSSRPTVPRRKKELVIGGHPSDVIQSETSDRPVEMSTTTSRSSVEISREMEGGGTPLSNGVSPEVVTEEKEEEEEMAATTEGTPVRMSVEAPPRDQLGRRTRAQCSISCIVDKLMLYKAFYA
jgi:hypothetical protein